MKKLAAVMLMLLMSGCANLKEAGNTIIDGISHPPETLLAYLRDALMWLVNILLQGFEHLNPSKWF